MKQMYLLTGAFMVITGFCVVIAWQCNGLRQDVEQVRRAAISLNKAVDDLQVASRWCQHEIAEHYREHERQD